ncbi:MAG TPA: gliding motility-associated C-terminal domain-containing protein, partial [Brumimicrobium sp.]|nr:gliding motility-associated C-terminal domain-containing protein [Brumimicrobium sp.]
SIVTLDLTISSLPIVVNSTVINDNCEAGTGEISIEANSSNAPLTYVWSNGETGTDLTHLSEGIYQVTISDTASCSITTTFQVSNDMGECGCFVYVANAFSPNGDGNNDFIPVRGECVNNLSFKIFNRWGNLVFETNKLNDGWDGYYKGELQNSGIYVYVLKATLENGETVNESGDITLLR